ncbi:uncharacterized protein LOC110686666 isoform X2 [Chenopodium quinoa]|uniref:uncharacterized protein LOC110686666 isoform X2 n=1 Tax=Chenopodium quinoa TaxID=63459 RepID=UPI000B76CDF2|nr:uncharacterized protein LOC110686666 isoform X2 [Chenopodium quinoa]
MPGPGPHMIYTLGSGLGLMVASNGRFSPHHCLCYSINAFFGPDIGSFLEWLTSTVGFGDSVGSAVADYIHHPFYYVVLLSFPLSLLYSWASRVALHKGILDSLSGENGKSSVYTWILSTGWWANRAPINPDAVIVISLLCTGLILGFIYIHRVGPSKSIKTQYTQSVKLIITIAALYCLWCASQIYLVQPRRPAVGEEADLGVLVFLFMYFFFPHSLCIRSMNPKNYHDVEEQLPL